MPSESMAALRRPVFLPRPFGAKGATPEEKPSLIVLGINPWRGRAAASAATLEAQTSLSLSLSLYLSISLSASLK